MIPLYNRLPKSEAETYSLVLTSAGIGNRVVGTKDGFRLDVPEPLCGAAIEAIGRYLEENPPADEQPQTPSPQVPWNYSGVLVALLLLCIHAAVSTSDAPHEYVTVFGANARLILNGDTYRATTALLMHADAAHLAGNMAGIALFGGAVCMITGTGAGWLMILFCGILGNLMNAYAYQAGHVSVGASTAVFSAIGILCGIQAVDAARTGKGWKRMLLVLGAGLALLAFMGTSAHSDIGAHLFGFLGGLPMGAIHRGLRWRPPGGSKMQAVCLAAAVVIPLLAWILGVLRH